MQKLAEICIRRPVFAVMIVPSRRGWLGQLFSDSALIDSHLVTIKLNRDFDTAAQDMRDHRDLNPMIPAMDRLGGLRDHRCLYFGSRERKPLGVLREDALDVRTFIECARGIDLPFGRNGQD